MKAIEFVRNLKGVPAHFRVEAQPEGGWLSQCPSCAPCPSVGLSLSFNQIGEDLIVRCYGGCSEEELLSGLYFPGDGVEVITWHQWLEREVKRGHPKEYLQSQLQKSLPLPKALCSKTPSLPLAMTFDELMAVKVDPRAELCGPWLKERTITEVYGWRGSGKSWFGLSLAYAVAAGVDFMRWSVTESKGVLYVDGEMDLEDIQNRITLIHKSEQKRAGKTLRPKLRYLADSNHEQFPDGIPNLGTLEGKALIEANLEGISLIVLDNLSTLYNSAIENDAESWVEVQDWMKGLRRRGISVVFIHHSGKGGQQRGTSKREDLCNNVVALKQPADHQAEDGCSFVLTFEKSRGVKGPAVAPFAAKLAQDEDGDLVWVLQTAKESKTSQVLALHEEGLGIREIARTLGMDPGNVSRALKKQTQGRVLSVVSPLGGGDTTQHTNKPMPDTTPTTHRTTLQKKALIERIPESARDNTPDNTRYNTVQYSALYTPSGLTTPLTTPAPSGEPQENPIVKTVHAGKK